MSKLEPCNWDNWACSCKQCDKYWESVDDFQLITDIIINEIDEELERGKDEFHEMNRW